MRRLVETYFKERSIVNHQIASFDDFLATIDNPNSRMQKIVDSTKAAPEDAEGGIFRLDPDRTGGNVVEIRFGRKRDERTGQIDPNATPTINIQRPMIREANGASHDLYPMEARLRNLNYSAPI
ncbi:MAG: DNA-directed RNA polymerase subunit B, partial [Thermoplasmata archaeon]|nr:DNA-directed RNA polymerase subunit B [Thermoplasmata archaeon]